MLNELVSKWEVIFDRYFKNSTREMELFTEIQTRIWIAKDAFQKLSRVLRKKNADDIISILLYGNAGPVQGSHGHQTTIHAPIYDAGSPILLHLHVLIFAKFRHNIVSATKCINGIYEYVCFWDKVFLLLPFSVKLASDQSERRTTGEAQKTNVAFNSL